jgi:DNA-binding NarL/FixJ family response regulator
MGRLAPIAPTTPRETAGRRARWLPGWRVSCATWTGGLRWRPPNRVLLPLNKVVVVDRFEMVIDGVQALVDAEPDLEVVGRARTPEDALRLVAERQPALVVTDVEFPPGRPLNLLKTLHRLHPSLPILVFTSLQRDLYEEQAIGLGAQGFVSKRDDLSVLLSAIRALLGGTPFASSGLARRLLWVEHAAGGRTLAVLSERELEVLEGLGRGLSTRDIASSLFLSEKTVGTHRVSLKRKLSLVDGKALQERARLHLSLQGPLEDPTST